jgi:hypothetical protein
MDKKKIQNIFPLVRLSGTRNLGAINVPNFLTCSQSHKVLDTELASVEINGCKYPIFLAVEQKKFKIATSYDLFFPNIVVRKALELDISHVISGIYFN